MIKMYLPARRSGRDWSGTPVQQGLMFCWPMLADEGRQALAYNNTANARRV